jgi:hypothetical protein
MYFVGAINSVLDEYKSNNYLTSDKFAVKTIYTHKKHGYVTIENNEIITKIKKLMMNKIKTQLFTTKKEDVHQFR